MRPLTRFFSFRDLGPVHLVRGLSQGTTMKGAAAHAFGTQARATASFDAGVAAAARGGPAGHTVAGRRRPLRRDWGGKNSCGQRVRGSR